MGVIRSGLEERADQEANEADAAELHRVRAEELLLAPG